MKEILLWLAVGLVLIVGYFITIYVISFSERIACYNEAKDQELTSEFKFHWIGNNNCVYILPNGKKIISTKYRAMEGDVE